jgi:hypothetical protein
MNAPQAPHTAADTPAGSAKGEDHATADAREAAAPPGALGMDPDQITLTPLCQPFVGHSPAW